MWVNKVHDAATPLKRDDWHFIQEELSCFLSHYRMNEKCSECPSKWLAVITKRAVTNDISQALYQLAYLGQLIKTRNQCDFSCRTSTNSGIKGPLLLPTNDSIEDICYKSRLQ